MLLFIQIKLYIKYTDKAVYFHLVLLLLLTCSVVPNSLQSHGLQHARLLCTWNFPGKNTAVDSHSFSRGSSQPRDQTSVLASPALTGRFFTTSATWETPHHVHQLFINHSTDTEYLVRIRPILVLGYIVNRQNSCSHRAYFQPKETKLT